MEQLQEFGLFLFTWAMVMLVVTVAGKRIARHARRMGARLAQGSRPPAWQPARILATRTGKELRG